MSHQSQHDSTIDESDNIKTDTDLYVTFRDIVYSVSPSTLAVLKAKLFGHKDVDNKVILRGLSGSFKSGQLTAIMGPSGSGKSVLLECLIGRRYSGLVGSITARNQSGPLKIAYIPQKDKVYGGLTVREALVFASKLQNYDVTESDELDQAVQNGDFHNERAVQVMTQLGLMVCSDTRISFCSGGQQKRVSIAMELVSRPSILVLDEPTSGLDSAACQAVIELLSDIAKGSPKVAVVVTIHQPSWYVFKVFDKVIMLSKETGNAIYEGPPEQVVSTLAHFECICPAKYNPADYLIEVACSFEGQEVVKKLTDYQKSCFLENVRTEEMVPVKLLDLVVEPVFPAMAHFRLLLQRSVILMLRDPLLLVVRFMVHILCGLCLWAVFKDSGGADGCPPKVPQTLGKMDVFKEMQEAYLQDAMRTFTNSSAIFFCALFLLFTSMMPTVLTFSSEIDILRKEVFNKWYSVTPFYFAKIFAELPLLVILSIIYCTIFYFGLENPNVSWRYASFTGIMMLNCIIGHAQGTLVSVIFVDHPEAGIYFTPVSVVPALLLSGFFVHMKDMKYFMTIASYTTYVRFLVETAIVVVYGYDRCGVNLARDLKQAQHVLLTWVGTNMGFDNGQGMGYGNASHLMGKFNPIETAHRLTGSIVGQVLNDYVGSDGEVRSRMLNEYTVDEDDVGPNIAIAIAVLILYRILAYFILYRKVNLKT